MSRWSPDLKREMGIMNINEDVNKDLNQDEELEETNVDTVNVDVDDGEDIDNNDSEKKFTQSQVEDMITKRLAREKKATEKAVAQAEKLATMNEDEKQAFELNKLKEELAELKGKDAYNGMSREASKMLLEQGIQANDELLKMVVKDDAESTKSSVDSFTQLINEKVEEGVKKVLAGKSPEVYKNNNQVLTKKSIMAEKDSTKRIRLISENPDLFK